MSIAEESSNGNNFICSVCFEPSTDPYKLQRCGCLFCHQCVLSYLSVRVQSGDVLDVPCLSATCKQPFTHEEVERLLSPTDLLERYTRYKGNRDVERDPNRTFCPNPLCSAVCDVPAVPAPPGSEQARESDAAASSALAVPATVATPRAVSCQSCGYQFCSLCHASWNSDSVVVPIDSPQPHHAFRTTASSIPMSSLLFGSETAHSPAANISHQCEVTYVVNRQRWNLLSRIGIDVAADDVMIKRCPCCGIPVERGPGCAQMLCLNCHHTFCWYCLTVLDGDVFLRHYESGVCRARLGHTPGDLRRHRARVAMALTCCGVVAVLLLPVIIVCSPCILTCVCCVRSLMNNSARGAGGPGSVPRPVSTPRHFTFEGVTSPTAGPDSPKDQGSSAERVRSLSLNSNNSPV